MGRKDYEPQGSPAVRGCLVAVLFTVVIVAVVGIVVVLVTQ